MSKLYSIFLLILCICYGHITHDHRLDCDIRPNSPIGGQIRIASISSSSNFRKNPPGRTLEYEPLISKVNEHYTAVIAEVRDDPLQKKLMIYIHANATFHNGVAITSDIVQKNISQKIEPFIQKVERLSKYVIRIRYTDHSENIIAILGSTPISIKKDDREIGSGPYQKIKENGKSITYQRYPNYWGRYLPNNLGRYNFEYVHYHSFANTDEAYIAFVNNTIDVYEERSFLRWQTIQHQPEFKTLPHPLPQPTQVITFHNRGMMTNSKLRKQLALLLNPNLVPSICFGHDTQIFFTQYPHYSIRQSLESVARSLDELGWHYNDSGIRHKDNRPLILYLSSPPKYWHTIVKYWQHLFRKVGIHLIISQQSEPYDLSIDLKHLAKNDGYTVPLWVVDQYRVGLKNHIGYQECPGMHLDPHRWWYIHPNGLQQHDQNK